jgi:hypothetical protein
MLDLPPIAGIDDPPDPPTGTPASTSDGASSNEQEGNQGD